MKNEKICEIFCKILLKKNRWKNCKISIKKLKSKKLYFLLKNCTKFDCLIKKEIYFLNGNKYENKTFKFIEEIDCIENNCKLNK